LGFNNAVGIMGLGLCFAFFLTLCLPKDSGKMKRKPIFKDLYSKSKGINILSSARFFLFGARDVWFVVALPVFLDISFDQQLYGPIIIKSFGVLNLTNDSNDYGEFIDSKISLNWKKRSYEVGIFYQPHNQAGGISFSLYGFK